MERMGISIRRNATCHFERRLPRARQGGCLRRALRPGRRWPSRWRLVAASSLASACSATLGRSSHQDLLPGIWRLGNSSPRKQYEMPFACTRIAGIRYSGYSITWMVFQRRFFSNCFHEVNTETAKLQYEMPSKHVLEYPQYSTRGTLGTHARTSINWLKRPAQ